VPDRKQNLPQLYRFCFLMTGEARKAQEAFHGTLRAAASSASNGQAPTDSLWFYRDARGRCLELSEHGLQPEDVDLPEEELSPTGPDQLKKVDPNQLAIWISAAPDPQRTALALFYLDQFDHREICELAEIRLSALSRLLAQARRQFQAWLNATIPEQAPPI
jgi:DNA-directed RNA polymerase specialized sigma24 family protein